MSFSNKSISLSLLGLHGYLGFRVILNVMEAHKKIEEEKILNLDPRAMHDSLLNVGAALDMHRVPGESSKYTQCFSVIPVGKGRFPQRKPVLFGYFPNLGGRGICQKINSQILFGNWLFPLTYESEFPNSNI